MIERRKSKISGWGVFATEPINKNKRIVTYTGEKIRNQESIRREERYINHACEPNCYTRVIGDTIWIIAARNIRKGEELTYDYATDGPGHIRCVCSPGCKVML